MELATIMAMRERRSSANVKSELRALPVLFCSVAITTTL